MSNLIKFNELPEFTDKPACAGDENPDAWFPDELIPIAGVRQPQYSHTPEAKRARSICVDCPVISECLSYALQFTGLQGIWANKDRYERESLQKKLGMRALKQVYLSNGAEGVVYV